MTEYIYKGFKVNYQIESPNATPHLYKANGYVSPADQKRKAKLKQKFHTEHPNKEGAQAEIRKLLEDYIDFEWQEYYEMQEKASSSE